MSSEIELSSSYFLADPEPCPPAPEAVEGICEVVLIPSTDELPYVFELTAGQQLRLSLSASANIDLILCDEAAYDEWVDSGLQTEHPPKPILALRLAKQHSVEYRQGHDGTLVVVLINLADVPVEVVVSARISG